ncbi:thermostable hemolysin [Photobacterium rosenbergii]|uniref:Thermostable hemolysin n=1 Tax=Photobacterium rosenbergii TaxID=294936 RepID=A0ABU3ZDI5_9GAMM|nr:thermostable hemolysin [Photobacterium rosenbergii]MDV5168181.1 thermostable hemolysin [Photobacterium rosenbergii]
MLSTFQLKLIGCHHPLRQDVEQHITERYRLAFNANVTDFMPLLLAVFNAQQQLKSACGIRVASTEALFLENYLSAPAEKLIMDTYHQAVERKNLIEIGQLASFSQGSAPMHFLLLTQYLIEQGYEWCIFTATDPLYAMMRRLGLAPMPLIEARAEHITNAPKIWGSYYQHHPRVCCGYLPSAYQQLLGRMDRLTTQVSAR